MTGLWWSEEPLFTFTADGRLGTYRILTKPTGYAAWLDREGQESLPFGGGFQDREALMRSLQEFDGKAKRSRLPAEVRAFQCPR